MPLTLTSSAFDSGAEIPSRFTCEGGGVSPPLAWTGAPQGTRSFVLIVDDPDAPDPRAPRTDWVHWVLYDLPSSVTALAEGAAEKGLPPGTHVGLNDSGRADYGPPCPPIGRHRYIHRLYALDVELPVLGLGKRPQVEHAMQGHVLAKAELVGTYRKHH